jgi:uncharacterized membrane protein YjfL (UPF0719 family)
MAWLTRQLSSHRMFSGIIGFVPDAPQAPLPSADVVETTRGLLRVGTILGWGLMLLPPVRALADRGGAAWFGAALFGVVALGVWGVAARAQGRLLFGKALRAEVARGNVAAAIAVAANQVSLALIVSRAVSGERPSELPVAVAFAALAILTWTIFVALFRLVTTYPDGPEIAGENQAAALSYAGVALALAVIVAHAVDGPFAGWSRSLHAYGAALVLALALYPVRQLVVEGVLLGCRPCLRGGELDRAIGQRRSVGVAAVEAAAYLATAWLVTGLG